MTWRRISTIEDNFSPFSGWVAAVKKQIFQVPKADMENCLRHNNLRIVGFPEKAEGQILGDFGGLAQIYLS